MMMIPRIIAVRYIADHSIRLRFQDGIEGEVNLTDELYGEVFQPLKNLEYFSSFQLHPELHTVVWPNGADFAPEFLRSALRVAA
jgi:hypothetical protein